MTPYPEPETVALDRPDPGPAPEEVDAARTQARELVDAILRASGSDELQLLDEVAVVGLPAQRNAGRQLELVRARMGAFFEEGGPSKDLADDMVRLRAALERINPDFAGKGFWERATGALPFLRGRNNPIVRSLRKIAVRYEPVSKQIVVIETRLRDGRTLLERDNIELRKLYEDVEAQQAHIRRQTMLGEVLVEELAAAIAATEDPAKRDRLLTVQHDVAMRAQDLRAMDEVHQQFFVSIELTRQNNRRLGQAVDRTVALATNIVTIGLAIQMALVHQERVEKATIETREFLGNVIETNASAINRHTAEIGDLYNNPVVAIEKIESAHHQLLEALDTASRLRQEGVETALRNIEVLRRLTQETERRVAALAPAEGGPA